MFFSYVYKTAVAELNSYGQYHAKEVTDTHNTTEIQKQFPPRSPETYVKSQQVPIKKRSSHRTSRKLFSDLENDSQNDEVDSIHTDSTFMPSESEGVNTAEESLETATRPEEEDEMFMVASHKGNLSIR